jgi:hypothetical protein
MLQCTDHSYWLTTISSFVICHIVAVLRCAEHSYWLSTISPLTFRPKPVCIYLVNIVMAGSLHEDTKAIQQTSSNLCRNKLNTLNFLFQIPRRNCTISSRPSFWSGVSYASIISRRHIIVAQPSIRSKDWTPFSLVGKYILQTADG